MIYIAILDSALDEWIIVKEEDDRKLGGDLLVQGVEEQSDVVGEPGGDPLGRSTKACVGSSRVEPLGVCRPRAGPGDRHVCPPSQNAPDQPVG